MQKTRQFASAVAGCSVALVIGLVGVVSTAYAVCPAGCNEPATNVCQCLPTSDKPAAILVWPKIVVDTSNVLSSSEGETDTLIQLSNAVPTRCAGQPCGNDLTGLKQAHCFYVDATGHCSNDPTVGCLSSDDCNDETSGVTGSCDPGWTEVDFDVRITPEQPLAWLASEGLQTSELPLRYPGTCSNNPNRACTTDDQCGGFTCNLLPSNAGTGVPPTPEDPFVGSLTCIQFDPSGNPATPDTSATANALIGNAAIEVALTETTGVDVQKYNAVGIQKLCTFSPSGTNCTLNAGAPDQLILGGPNAAYQGCPARLILNHLFDGAEDPIGATGTTTTDLTLVPCGNDFLRQVPGQVTAQFLVFNEFEQRFSTSANVDCFYESQISNIDTPRNDHSIFSYNVAGTLAGQTIIRGVGSADTGQGLLGVARVFIDGINGAAYNLNEKGTLSSQDVITIP